MDNINPDHYKNQTSLECIEAMEIIFGKDAVMNFCMCNAWKYIWRWKNKCGIEDLKKAMWYIDKATDYLSGSDGRYKYCMRMKEYIEENQNETMA